MSEKEFELYLRLLAKCLALTPGQRQTISDELRDHLEERLAELERSGVPRAQAALQALDEFGDAAILANHFTAVSRLKRRKLIMRASLGSAGLLAAGLFIASAFWPENAAMPVPGRAVAQNDAKANPKQPAAPAGLKTPPTAKVPLTDSDTRIERIESALDELGDFDVPEQPLSEALEFVKTKYNINLAFDTRAINEAGVDLDSTVKSRFSSIRLRSYLKLLLEQQSSTNRSTLLFCVRDDVLWISTREAVEHENRLVIYDCRDLIGQLSRRPDLSPEIAKLKHSSEGQKKLQSVEQAAALARAIGQLTEAPAQTPTGGALIRVIAQITDSQESATEIEGMLIVNDDPLAHQQIKDFLSDLRKVSKDGAFASEGSTSSAAPVPPIPPAAPRDAPK